MLQLPPELLSEIVSQTLAVSSSPTHLLRVNSQFYAIGTHVLYSRLRFRSIRQLLLFSQSLSLPPYLPREIHVVLSGGTADFDVFKYLANAITRCIQVVQEGSESAKLPLELMYLQLNSHTLNPNLGDIYDALILINPKTFVWIGPDPGHHFSNAIVPRAAYHLFRPVSTWREVEQLKITNIACAADPGSTVLDSSLALLPSMPSLRSLYLGQATHLVPGAIAAMVCLQDQPSLEEVRIVDAYRESIWGRRVRRADIEKMVLDIEIEGGTEAALERIRRIVRCEAQNERVMGGDRAEGLLLLV